MSRFRFRPEEPDGEILTGPDIPDPEFSQAVLAMLTGLARESVLRDGWDAGSVLGAIYLNGRTPVGSAASMRSLWCSWEPFPGSATALQRAGRPHHAIVGLANGIRATGDLLPSVRPDNLVAIGVLNEGWTLGLQRRDWSQEERRRMEKLAAERKIHEAPDRVEIKIVSAVDVNGVRYGHFRPRDSQFQPQSMIAVAGATEGPQLGGEVPDSLHYLISAIEGRTLPEYDEWSEQFQPPTLA